MKDIHDFPTSFLAHLERARKEKDRRLIKAFETEDDGKFKKFSHKMNITEDLYYNIICGDVTSFARLKDSLSFSQSDKRQQRVNLSRLDRIYVDDFFVGKGGEIGIISGSLFSDHATAIMVVGKHLYHNNSCGRIPKWI